MSGYQFFRMLQMFVVIGLLVLGSFAMMVGFIGEEIATESAMQRRFGENWKTEYEEVHGSLAAARAKVAACAVGLVGESFAVTLLYRSFSRRGKPRSSRPKRQSHSELPRSPIERIYFYRRKALVRIYFGAPGLLLAVALVFVRFGIFEEHSNEVLLALAIFVAGYCSVISGCWYWAKGKGWNESVVLIGLMPLGLLFVPFVRLVFIANPVLLFCPMVMMPLILIVVMSVLPDKSGLPQRRRGWSVRAESEKRNPIQPLRR